MTSLPQFNGLRASSSSVSPVTCQRLGQSSFTLYINIHVQVAVQPMKRKGNGALGACCDFIGSSTNLIMVTSTNLMLFAGRDPAGFTLAVTLACGTVGHIIGVGVVLGLKNISAI
ncbi:PSI-K [Heracleum sosnowskyi]|uniref:PSI-K n=1 Tax=Heracleum sosnowskyi TaxID=360622 RepID=A0AAD8IS10_9APIA|nr:PSI-K [Heracleum sosnowskyi]